MRAATIVLLLSPTSLALAGTALPTHYTKLFERGTSWTYDVSVTTWDYEKLEKIDTPNTAKTPWPKKTEKLVVTCKVARTATLGTSTVSEITCDRPVDRKFDTVVPRTFIANKAGLYAYLGTDTFPTSKADLENAELLIAAKPKVVRTKRQDDFPKATFITGVRKTGVAWCIYTSSKGAPHDGDTSLCFDGRIASGGNDVAAELDDVEFRAR